MDAALLDTDILSEVIKRRDLTVAANAAVYLQQHGQFTFSVFTQFEITRGYLEKQATTQLARFTTFCQHSRVLPLTDDIFARAANLWAFGRRMGYSPGDADLLIAATALDNGYVLVTGNTAHFQWIPALRLENWRHP